MATLCWNHHRHPEAYFGIPACGAVLHTLNLRLHANDLAYIVNHAQDKVLLIDESLLPLFETFRERVNVAHVVVLADSRSLPQGLLDYEQLLSQADEAAFRDPDLNEDQAAAMCYTSGTTGQPKGVVYSHRSLVLHALGAAMVDSMGIGEADAVLPVVPMFHANAWGLPFVCALVGATLLLPGRHLDPVSVADLLHRQRVTVSAGVPTVWLGLLQLLDRDPAAYHLSSLRTVLVGGSAVPRSLIAGFQERYGVRVLQL